MNKSNPSSTPTNCRERALIASVGGVVTLLLAVAGCSDVVSPEEDLRLRHPHPTEPQLSISPDAITTTVLLPGTARDISETGLITGGTTDGAFLWKEGSVQLLGVLDETLTNPLAIPEGLNDLAQVTGWSTVSTDDGFGRTQAFLWENGSMISLPDPVATDVTGTRATAVNAGGDVVGWVILSSGGTRAVHWPDGGSAVLLPSLASSTFPEAFAADVNDRGQIVGASRNADGRVEATVWENGVRRGLGLVGGSQSRAVGINDQGDVVGWAGGNVVLWPHDDSPLVLGQPGFFDGSDLTLGRVSPQDLNDRRQIVGSVSSRRDRFSNPETRGFLWAEGTFTELKAPGQDDVSRVHTRATAINDAGQIVGTGNTPEGRQALLWHLPSFVTVAIDIKPGGDPNAIDCTDPETTIPVAILSTHESAGDPLDFDAATVDHTTVSFEGGTEIHVRDGTTDLMRHEEDVDADGDTDLVVHVRHGDTGLTCLSNEGTLTGETFDGTAIEGTDAIRMVEE